MSSRTKRNLWVLFLSASVLALVVLACCPSTSSTGTSGGVPATKAPEATQAAASTAKPAEPQVVQCKVGDQCVSGGIAVTVLGVEKTDDVGSSIFKPDEGNTYLVIEVLIENPERDEETPYNPLYFKLKDSDGFDYTMAFGGKDPSLKSGDLVKGDKARGFVTFEVPVGATGFVVTYEPLVLFGGYKPIRVDLGL